MKVKQIMADVENVLSLVADNDVLIQMDYKRMKNIDYEYVFTTHNTDSTNNATSSHTADDDLDCVSRSELCN